MKAALLIAATASVVSVGFVSWTPFFGCQSSASGGLMVTHPMGKFGPTKSLKMHLTPSEKSTAAATMMVLLTKHCSGGWLPRKSLHVVQFINNLKAKAANLKATASTDSAYWYPQENGCTGPHHEANVNAMIKEAGEKESKTPLDQPSLESWDEFLELLNLIMHTALKYTVCETTTTEPCNWLSSQSTCSSIGQWQLPMATPSSPMNSLTNSSRRYWSKWSWLCLSCGKPGVF